MIKNPSKKSRSIEAPVKQGVRPEDSAPREERYVEAVGRRKTAVARARVTERGKGITVTVNGRTLQNYFPLRKFQAVVIAAFSAVSMKDATVTVKTMGGGTRAQAEAIRLAIARALVRKNVTSRPRLKTLGFLKRDPRMVERKKPGLRKARRPQQWRKR